MIDPATGEERAESLIGYISFPEKVRCAVCGAECMGWPDCPATCSKQCRQRYRWQQKAAKVRRKRAGI